MHILTSILVFLTVGSVSTAEASTANASAASTGSAVKLNESQLNVKSEAAARVQTAGQPDLDAEVTDIKLRATSGAKSKYSSSFTLNYAGASLAKPLGDERPNVGEGRVATPVNMTGNVGLRYRRNKNESAYFATGFSQARPFHARNSKEELEISTPHLGYNRTHAIDELQIGSTYLLYVTTLDRLRAIGEVATLGYALSAKNKIGQSRFIGGLSMNIWAVNYDKHYDHLRRMQNDYGISLTPGVQFNSSDRMNFYTALSVLNYSHFRSEDKRPLKFEEGVITQTLGMGAAVVRDFYLSPYISFEPTKISSDKTAVNLSATINL